MGDPAENLLIFVPTPGSKLEQVVDRGSALVGRLWDEPGPPKYMVDFEGNRYGAVNMRRYVERVHMASSRQRAEYPTIARMVVESSEVSVIGVWQESTHRLVIVGDAVELLEEWLGVSPIPKQELVY